MKVCKMTLTRDASAEAGDPAVLLLISLIYEGQTNWMHKFIEFNRRIQHQNCEIVFLSGGIELRMQMNLGNLKKQKSKRH